MAFGLHNLLMRVSLDNVKDSAVGKVLAFCFLVWSVFTSVSAALSVCFRLCMVSDLFFTLDCVVQRGTLRDLLLRLGTI